MIPDRLQYFLNDSETSRMLTESGPVHLLFITEMLQRQEMMETSLNILFHIWEFENLRIFEISETIGAIGEILKFRKDGNLKRWKVEDEDWEMMKISVKKCPNSWIWI